MRACYYTQRALRERTAVRKIDHAHAWRGRCPCMPASGSQLHAKVATWPHMYVQLPLERRGFVTPQPPLIVIRNRAGCATCYDHASGGSAAAGNRHRGAWLPVPSS